MIQLEKRLLCYVQIEAKDDERMWFAYSTNDILLLLAPDPAGKVKSPSKRSKKVV